MKRKKHARPKAWRGKLWASLTGDGRTWYIGFHDRPALSSRKTELPYGCKAVRVEVTLRIVPVTRRKR